MPVSVLFPELLIPGLAAAGGYGILRPRRRRGVSAWRAACFRAGPMDVPAGHSFEVHILQHMRLMKASPLPALPGALNTVLLQATEKHTLPRHSEYPDRREA